MIEEKKTKKIIKKPVHKTKIDKDEKEGGVILDLVPEQEEVKILKNNRYIQDVGRRKTSTARVRLFTQGEKIVLVNEKDYKNYFPTLELQETVVSPLKKMNCQDKFRIQVKVKGGGISSQAEAVRHGIARALLNFNLNFRKKLRKAGYLTTDSRQRERKKFGLKRARRAPQWAKR